MADATPNPKPTLPDAEDLTASVPESWRAEEAQLTGPAQRIALIEDSQRCAIFGWLSLVPFLGTIFLGPALTHFKRVDRQREVWNPAQHLQLRGLVSACFGYWTSLLWWGLFMLWLGAVTEVISMDDLSNGDPLLTLGYVLLFGSAPALVGLTLAAARSSDRLGKFAGKNRVGLIALGIAAYGGLLAVFTAEGWPGAGVRFSARDPEEATAYVSLITWSLWMLGGLVWLRLWKTRSPLVWIVWLLGAALLTAWMTGN